MLWLGLIARDTGVPASQRLKIRNEVLAIDFDKAVSLRLLEYDSERMQSQAKLTAIEVSKIFSGEADAT